MTLSGWNRHYLDILHTFGYSKQLDYESAWLLNSMLKNPIATKRIERLVKGKTVFVIGSGPSISKSLPILKKYKKIPKIVADGATKALVENQIKPDIVVTDLDGDRNTLKKVGKSKTIMVAHAHGDNIANLSLIEYFQNCLGTTQGKQFGKLYNFGGFTDGDRAVFLANHFEAKKIVMFGMDFGPKIGKYSMTKPSERKIKLKKLRFAKKLLQWLAKKSRAELYTTSTPVLGFEKIDYEKLDDIIIT